MNKYLELDFLISALSDGEFIKTDRVLDWLEEKNNKINSEILLKPLHALTSWVYDQQSVRHNTGKFFSIEGLRVTTNRGLIQSWEQPIINQPEIGFLGIIVKKINGILHFLLQAKIEPGNINLVQLSPTLQATRSNYTCVHKGHSPLYLEYFNGQSGKNVRVLIDQLQSEQGARFYKKRNRNIIIEIDDKEPIEIYDNYVWLSLGQIKKLLEYDNVVNMDTRTVIACIGYGSYSQDSLDLLGSFFSNQGATLSFLNSLLCKDGALYSIQEIHNWLTGLKFKTDLDVIQVPLSEVKDWEYDGEKIVHKDGKYFSVIGVHVKVGNREVVTWQQPMIKPSQEGLIAFVVKKINGIYHFLIQAKTEAGNFDLLELAPTVQCLTGNYREGKNEYSVPFIGDVLNADPDQIWYVSNQSEEGGRFYKEQNLNMIVEVGDSFDIIVPENYCWMTLNQLISFVSYNNYLNIAARSLLSAIKLEKWTK